RGVGILGFSMGAAYGLWIAAQRPTDVLAAILFYGVIDVDLAPMRAAVQGHFAENDEFDSVDVVREFEATLRELRKDVEFFVYPGARHAFFNPTRPEAYDPAAADLAWQRTIAFLRRHLS